MFVSKKEAAERLGSVQNVLGKVAHIEEQETDADAVKDKRSDAHESDAVDVGSSPDDIDDDEPSKHLLDSLDKLDSMLEPRKKRMLYRQNRPAQIAVAETAVMLGPTAAGQMFGLGIDQAGAYSNGERTSNANLSKPIPEVKRAVNDLKEKISLIAARKLKTTLIHGLSKDKIESIESPLEAGRLAKDLAVVVDKMEKKDVDKGQGIHFHIFTPEVKKLSDYDTINVTPRKPAGDETSV